MMSRDKIERVRGVVRKEFIQIFRDPRLARVVFVAPVVQLLMFGYAVSTDVRFTASFLVDHDRTAASRRLVEALTSSEYFRIVGRSERPADLVRALERGSARVGIEIPAGYARDLHAPGGARVQLLFDGSNSNVALVARGYAEQIVRDHAIQLAGAADRQPVELRERAWFNPGLVSRNYNVPGVVGLLLLLLCMLLTSLAVVRERELGTLEQLMVSPLTPGELIAGKTIPFGLIAIVDLLIVMSVAVLWFRIPFVGNPLLVLLASVLYLFSGLGLGLLISTISKTQQEAFLSSFLVLMPTVLLSGFMFPVTSMPAVFQWFTLLNPVRHYLEIVRAVFLKGAGLSALWPQFVALALMGSSILWFASTRFHKTSR
jgi:ABC-2 type transport system permease protein